jgi:hypothetical protein
VLALGGVEFDCCGYVRLTHGTDPAFPPRVQGIPIGQSCRALHFLHTCEVPPNCAAGTQIGTYTVHYAGEGQEEIPIVYGQNVLRWTDTRPLVGQASEAWSGKNDSGDLIRLFKFAWQNPRPETQVQSIDFMATRPDSSPILFAITAER